MARPLAAIALTSVAAANIHKSPEISHRHEPSSNEAVIVTTPNIQRASFAQSERDHTPRTIARPENQAYQPRYIAPIEHPRSSPETSLVTPDRKLEHMPLLSLLTLAKDVRLGYGRYLKDEFEKGHIDKAGLVKVLKAKKKGLDISREYTTQASDYRKRQGSIEFLSKSTDGNMAADAMPETSIATQTDNRKSDKGFQVIKEEFPHPVFERYTHPDKSVFQTSPKGPVPVNLIVTIAIIITLGIAMLLLLLPAFT